MNYLWFWSVKQFNDEEDQKTVRENLRYPKPHKHDVISCLAASGKWITQQPSLQVWCRRERERVIERDCQLKRFSWNKYNTNFLLYFLKKPQKKIKWLNNILAGPSWLSEIVSAGWECTLPVREHMDPSLLPTWTISALVSAKLLKQLNYSVNYCVLCLIIDSFAIY